MDPHAQNPGTQRDGPSVPQGQATARQDNKGKGPMGSSGPQVEAVEQISATPDKGKAPMNRSEHQVQAPEQAKVREGRGTAPPAPYQPRTQGDSTGQPAPRAQAHNEPGAREDKGKAAAPPGRHNAHQPRTQWDHSSSSTLATPSLHSRASSTVNGYASSSSTGARSSSGAGPSTSPSQPRGLKNQEVKHIKIDLSDSASNSNLQPVTGSTIGTLLNMANDLSKQANSLHIFFLPPLAKRSGDAEGLKTLLAEPGLCQELTDALHLDKSFFTREAFESNGFMQSQQGWGSKDDETHSFAARFLIKLLQASRMRNVPKYSWYYLSFCVLWLRKASSQGKPKGEPSCIVVCFDNCSTTIRDGILDAFEAYPRARLRESPIATYDVLLRAFFAQYDEALWQFRDPVRNLEENRLDIARGIQLLGDNGNSSEHGVIQKQIEMHELSRHAIHTSETLQVAAQTVGSALSHFEAHVVPVAAEERTPTTVDILAGLHTSAGLLANLKLRADSFVKRLENEIQLSYNIIGLYQLRNIQSLVSESRDEGKDAATVVTFMTFLFLPPTFIAGFWGMNFITTENGKTVVGGDVWKFWIWSICTVVACCAIWGSVHYGKWRPSLGTALLTAWRKTRGGLRKLRVVWRAITLFVKTLYGLMLWIFSRDP